nr:MAG TPA: hypothetical protein [Caudoviricetes sp.]
MLQAYHDVQVWVNTRHVRCVTERAAHRCDADYVMRLLRKSRLVT